MKQIVQKLNKRNKFFAIGVIALIALFIALSGGLVIAGGLSMAFALPILSDEDSAIVAHMKTEFATHVDKFEKGYITQTKLEEFFTEKLTEIANSQISKDEFKSLQDSLDAQGLELRKLTDPADADKTLKDELIENKELLEKATSKAAKEVEFQVLKADVTRASVTNSTQALRLTDIGQLAHRKLVARDAFTVIPVGPESNGVIRYADWDLATTVRAAAMVAEGAAFPESTAVWEEFSLELKKIGDTIPVTEETIKDAGRFAAELNSFLETNVNIVEDTQLLTGSGVGNNMTGVYVSAPTWTPVASGISDANIYDMIVKMAESITAPYGSKYMPDFIFMNIVDINKMKLKKDANENYIIPPFVTESGQKVDGIMVIEANGITADTAVLGDSRYAKIYEVEGFSISVGYTGDQFTEDLMTLKGRKRENLLIRNVDKTGFLKVTGIAAALVTLGT